MIELEQGERSPPITFSTYPILSHYLIPPHQEHPMTPNELRDLIVMIAATALSLIFSYLPGVSDWFAKLDPTRKRLLMLGILFLAVLLIFGVTCANLVAIAGLTCDRATLVQLVQALVLAAIANQTTFQLSPQRNRARG